MFGGLRPIMAIGGLADGPSLETYLLARHRAIDALLQHSITKDGVGQVLEVAAGLSPRGWRFTQRSPGELTYIEADLPGMAQRKRRALERMGALSDHLRVANVDALRPGGPGSLEELAATLDPDRGLVIVTEGLTSYLDTETMLGLWRRLATILSEFRAGRYLADVMPQSSGQHPFVRAGRLALSGFVRGRVHLHFPSESEAAAALLGCGFVEASVRPAHEIAPAEGQAASLSLARIADARAPEQS
jgi:O-methyltransferase involved in polyketide biosynthesis